MEKISINKRIPIFIFAFLVFAVMPVIYSPRLLDPELSFRFIGIALIVIFFFLYFLLKGNIIPMPSVNQTITFIFIVYIFLNVVGLLNSINKGQSFYELIRLFVFLCFYLCLVIMFQKNDVALSIIIKNINIAILLFSSIGFFQLYPLIVNFIEKGIPIEIKLSVSSSLGNKNFYSETLLMALPFIVYGVTVFKTYWKAISVFNIIIIVITIFSLQAVAVWLGLFAGLFLFTFFIRRNLFENKKIRTRLLILFGCISVLAVVTLISKPSIENSALSKFKVVFKYINNPDALDNYAIENNNSTYERIILWRNSFKMIKDHPFFGVGLGEWKIHFPKYGMGAAPYMNSGMIRFEKPHNDFILTCCETGIPGLICYLALFIISFIYCKRIITTVQSSNDKLLMRLMAAALFAFVIISMSGYPNQRPYTMIFFMLVLAIIQSKYLHVFPGNENRNAKKYYRMLFISGILISAFGLSIGIKRMKAEMHLSNALVAQKYRNWGIMIRESTLAECYYFPMDFTSTPIYWYEGFANFYSGNNDQAFLNFEKAEKINPYHFNLLNDLGTCYDLKGNSEMAKSYYQRANKIAPSFPDAIINLSVIYYNAGNLDSAYYFISKNNLRGNPNYFKDLKVILFAKAQKIVSQISDPAVKAYLTEKIYDEKWLLALQEETKKTNQTLEQLLRSQHKP